MSLLDTALNETASCVNMKSSAVGIRGCVQLANSSRVPRPHVQTNVGTP